MIMFLTSIWLMQCLAYFLPLFLLLPVALIPKFGVTLYRKITGVYDHYGRLTVMAIPFSWCLPSLKIKDYVRVCLLISPSP